MENDFIWPVRVYYEDTDCEGVVYHASYLRFMERARTEWLRHHGLEQSRLRVDHNVLFTVSKMEITYLRPGFYDDALEVGLRPIHRGGASFKLFQWIARSQALQSSSGSAEPVPVRLCEAQVRIACVDAHHLKPTPTPNAIAKELVQ